MIASQANKVVTWLTDVRMRFLFPGAKSIYVNMQNSYDLWKNSFTTDYHLPLKLMCYLHKG